MRLFAASAVLAAVVCSQDAPQIVLIIDKTARPEVAEALKQGAEAAVAELAKRPSGPKPCIAMATVEDFAAREAFPGAAAVIVFIPSSRLSAVLRTAQERRVPVFDLGAARIPRSGSLDLRGPLAPQATSASYWIFGPLAHHHVALFHGGHPEDPLLLKAFAVAAKA